MKRMKPKAYNGNEPYIFVSYSHEDDTKVWELIRNLQERGYRIWYDEGIYSGNEWTRVIENRVANCSGFICFITANYWNSQNCLDELEFSIDKGKRETIILAFLSRCEIPSGIGIELRLGRKQHLYRADFPTNDAFLNQLCQSNFMSKSNNRQKSDPVGKKETPDFFKQKRKNKLFFFFAIIFLIMVACFALLHILSSQSNDSNSSNSSTATLKENVIKYTDNDYVQYTDNNTGKTSYYGLFKKNDIDFSDCESTADYYNKMETFCEDMGGHLAVINTDEENEFLYNWVCKATDLKTALFGLSDCENESYNTRDHFVWVDGSETRSHWQNIAKKDCPIQPNNKNEGNKTDADQDFVIFYTNPSADAASWNDVSFYETSSNSTNNSWDEFICEWDDLNGISGTSETSLSEMEKKAKESTDDYYLTYTNEKTGKTSYYGLFDKDNIDYSNCEKPSDYYKKLEDYCEERGGHLAVFNTIKENNYVYEWVSSSTKLKTALFGLSDCEKESDDKRDYFVWVDGSDGCNNWSNTTRGEAHVQPNGNGDFVIFYTANGADPGTWSDVTFNNKTGTIKWEDFICEWDEE